MEGACEMDEKVFAGKYRAIRDMSSDASGRTWLAAGPVGEVVVKVMRPPDAESTELIEEDVELVSGVRHPALPAIIEWGHQDGDFYVVREYVAGTDLKKELDVQGRFAPYTVARYGSAAAEALAALHERGVAHGNVRTANLIRTPSDEVKLAGGGLGMRNVATELGGGAPASAAAYLAPERVEGGPPSPVSDIYALGAVLYELTAGRPPFEGESAAVVADHQLHSNPVPLSTLDPEVPTSLESVIMKALEKSPGARWPSAEEMRAALDGVEQAESPVPTPAPEEAPARKSGRGGMWIAIVIALVALVALGAAWALGLFGGGGTAVPGVVGKTLPEARAALTVAGLDVGVVTYAGVPVAGVADGLVSEQAPIAGSKAPAGTKVDLILAGREMVSVPLTTGRTQADASSLIQQAGLTVGTITTVATTSVGAGIVTSQSPGPESQAAKGTSVDLWVAQAPTVATVPDVVGLEEADANSTLVNAGFSVDVVDASSSSVTKGLVIDQAPTAGVTAQPGSTVTIRVSTGPSQATVPSVMGKTQADAVNALTAAGFLSSITLHTGGGPVGTVIGQSPAGGKKANTGSTVTITVVQ
jgi:beta-lactam-binding protein with PASTA domain